MSGKQQKRLRRAQGVSIQARREMADFEREWAETRAQRVRRHRQREARRDMILFGIGAALILAGVIMGALR